MQIELLIYNHRRLHVLVNADSATLLSHLVVRVRMQIRSRDNVFMVIVSRCLESVRSARSTYRQTLLVHFAAAVNLLLLLLRVIVLHVHNLLEWVIIFGTLLA
jgi:hypothetical protein